MRLLFFLDSGHLGKVKDRKVEMEMAIKMVVGVVSKVVNLIWSVVRGGGCIGIALVVWCGNE